MSIDLNMTYKAKDGYMVELSEAIVRDGLAKGTVPVNAKDIFLFEKFCESKLLNPFVGDAYLLKYKTDKDADIVTTKSYLLKTLKRVKGYQWHSAGILVASTVDGQLKIDKLLGTYYTPGLQELVGGWAEVMLNDHLNYHSVNMSEFNKGRNTWTSIPSVMIRKVALSQLCDEVSPEDFGGMYLEEELIMSGAAAKEDEVTTWRNKIIAIDGGKHEHLVVGLTSVDALKALYETITVQGGNNVEQPTELEP